MADPVIGAYTAQYGAIAVVNRVAIYVIAANCGAGYGDGVIADGHGIVAADGGVVIVVGAANIDACSTYDWLDKRGSSRA